jgi:hypothetical protein
MFNIDFKLLITWLLPVLECRPKAVLWLQSLFVSSIRLYNTYLLNREKNLYRLDHDSRVFSIENVLNDRFDNSARRIYIEDGFAKDRVYIFTRNESKPIYLGKISLYNRADYADTGIDFIVWIPTSVIITTQDLIELNALVSSYKLLSKRFKIYRS